MIKFLVRSDSFKEARRIMANLPQLWFSHFRDLDQFRRDFDDLFDRLIGGHQVGTPGGMTASPSIPALESFVENGRLVVRADLPGIDPKDVEVSVNENNLLIRAVRQHDNKSQERAWVHREVSYGSFERSISLPQGVSADEVTATYRSGVLELTMPLPRLATGRKVPIQIQSGGADSKTIEAGSQSKASQSTSSSEAGNSKSA
jgi:HSP20 family protein